MFPQSHWHTQLEPFCATTVRPPNFLPTTSIVATSLQSINVPLVSFFLATCTILPQSHLQVHLRGDSTAITVRLPNFLPRMLIWLAFEVFSLCKHPQDLVCPLLRCAVFTVISLPQSHLHSHFPFPAYLIAVSLLYFWLVMSMHLFSFAKQPQEDTESFLNNAVITSV